MDKHRPISRLVNWTRLHCLAICMALAGVVILRLSHLLHDPDWGTVIKEVGAITLVSALGGFLWEVVGRLSLLTHLLEDHGLCAELAESGLIAVLPFARVDWTPLFRGAQEVDLGFCLGRAWRDRNLEHLRQFARARGRHMRVILPDPTNPNVLAELTRRFRSYAGYSNRLREDISDSIQFYRSLQVDGVLLSRSGCFSNRPSSVSTALTIPWSCRSSLTGPASRLYPPYSRAGPRMG